MKSKLFVWLFVALLPLMSWAQTKNNVSEVRDYRVVDGKIIITCVVNGVDADFVLDLAGQTAILPEYVEKLNVDPDSKGKLPYDTFQFKKIPTSKVVSINSVSFGNSAFANELGAFVLEDEPYLRELGVAGIMGGALFRGVVLTIDSRRKKITMSLPYRPAYMKLDHRANAKLLQGVGMECPVIIDGMAFSCILDTWTPGLVELNEADFTRWKGEPGNAVSVYNGYGNTPVSSQTKVASQCDFVRESFQGTVIPVNGSLVRSVVGAGILEYGILSLDFSRQTIYFQPFDLVEVKDEVAEKKIVIEPGKLNEITGIYFRENIHDYKNGTEFTYKGDKPVA